MTTFRKLSTAIATGAVLLSSVAPAFANTIEVSGNGAFSGNTATQTNSNSTTVSQSNTANVSNNVSSNSSTGGNSANFNTGGNTTVDTGNASNNVSVSTDVNKNVASVGCGCAQDGTDVKISGNGAFSENNAAVLNANSTTVAQSNNANISNDIDAHSSTGHNDAGFNTGGNTTIRTGDASTSVDVTNHANANIANVGGGSGLGGGSSIIISGNGAFSQNSAALLESNSVILAQSNDADIDNDVDADAKTGGNSAGFNTGGDTMIDTGDADTDVSVDNMVNFNAADVDCGCVLGGGTDVKIAGNGAYSESEVGVANENVLVVASANDADLNNDVDGNAKTGHNDASFATGDAGADPAIHTGDSSSTTDVSNSGNVNIFDQGVSLDLPGDWDLGLHFDLFGLWSFMHLV